VKHEVILRPDIGLEPFLRNNIGGSGLERPKSGGATGAIV